MEKATERESTEWRIEERIRAEGKGARGEERRKGRRVSKIAKENRKQEGASG